jgi:hypothetical protein
VPKVVRRAVPVHGSDGGAVAAALVDLSLVVSTVEDLRQGSRRVRRRRGAAPDLSAGKPAGERAALTWLNRTCDTRLVCRVNQLGREPL